MRVAIFSDIHANLAALEAALKEAERRNADTFICLGDVVGYGPDPGPCVDLVRERFAACVLGNHDEAVAFDRGMHVLPRDGQAAAQMHRTMLSEEQIAWLRGLPLIYQTETATYTHAAPLDPGAWPRLDSFAAVQAQFAAFETPVCFVGHSHRPAVASASLGVLRVRPGHRFLVNVGSVGQPRDKDPRLAFALFDEEAFACEVVRCHYNVAQTAARVEAVGLPSSLGERLRRGV
ncbi:MAG: metallophosphoesterase family protein [Rubricoccaceae bacterium]